MPRKTKEQTEKENKKEKVTKKPTTKKTAKATKTTATKAKATKTVASKKATTTTTAKKKSTATKAKATTKKATTKKVATKKATTKTSATKKSTTVKKTSAKKSPTKRTTTTKRKTTRQNTTKALEKKVEIVEYYDLPYRYNQTIVKVLAQTPTNLFIYWDISDKDRKNFEKQYGEHFFENTKPVLIVYNNTLGYHFEVEINDFANSWYLHVNDSKCDYKIELGRRPISNIENLNSDYIYVTTSNEIESPNDRILFDKIQKIIHFKNVKTGQQFEKLLNSISILKNMGKIYDIYDLYKAIYQDENIEDFSNPSSGSFSSKFK